MSCNQHNPCHQPTCNECNPENPCYDNCGCLNPTTFECITNFKRNYPNIPLNISDNGNDLLLNLDTSLKIIREEYHKVKSDDSDICPSNLFDKIKPGNENINISVSGTGCNRYIYISAGEGIGDAAPDVKVAISQNDNCSDFLGNKIKDGIYVKTFVDTDITNCSKLYFDINPVDLISSNNNNALSLGFDGKLNVLIPEFTGTETKILTPNNSGLTISGEGSLSNPYIINTNGALFRLRPYFNNVWRNLTFNNGSNSAVTIQSQNVSFRYRWDGTIEFKGFISYTVNFSTSNKISINSSQIPANGVNNVSSLELNRTVNIKNFLTFDNPFIIDNSPSLLGYNINVLAALPGQNANIQVEFLSNVSGDKLITLTFDGCQYHPNI
mgnify:CR=1 FL=1